jgi:hypothetical protein
MSTMTIDQRLGVEIKPGVISMRVLDFDCECRPVSWYGGDWVTKQITAIAWKYTDERAKVQPRVAVIGESFDSRQVLEEEARMLEAFVEEYSRADVVTGHFITGFDLPLVNGSLMRLGLPGLPDKLAQDTKGDLAKAQGLSKSQESLGAMFGQSRPKIHMNTALWHRANLLLPDGIEFAKERVIGDVNQHIQLRQIMLDAGVLGPPSVWSARAGHGSTKYQP